MVARIARQERVRRRRWDRELRRRRKLARQREEWSAVLAEYEILSVPPKLSWVQDDLPVLLEFLETLRTRALKGRRPIFIDLQTCIEIDPVACLLLTAEVERCVLLRPGCLGARDTRSPAARYALEAMGFYGHLGIEPPNQRAFGHILQIQTGGVPREGEPWTSNTGQKVYHVAKLASQVFGDATFGDHVHGALNEAADNIISWAYDPDLVDEATCLRRWWVAGVTSKEKRRAHFFAYDQGVGIPRSAPRNLGERFKQKLGDVLSALGLASLEDHHVLKATIDERRTRSGSSTRGKGLNNMIDLIDLVDQGAIWIFSGGAAYGYVKNPGNEPLEMSGAIGYRIPGTLVIWSITAPAG